MSTLGLKARHTAANFQPRIQFNAKTGRLIAVNETRDARGEPATVEIDVTDERPRFCFDFGSLEIGWLVFDIRPDTVLVPFGQPFPEQPSRNHKAGFGVQVWHPAESASRDFRCNSGIAAEAMDELWDAFETAPEAASGLVPVVQFGGTTPVRASRGLIHKPIFTILQWIGRDDGIFGPRTVAPPGAIIATPAPAPAAFAQLVPVQSFGAPPVAANGNVSPALAPAAFAQPQAFAQPVAANGNVWQASAPPTPAPVLARAW